MSPDGQLSIWPASSRNTQRYDFGFQALPWLEVSAPIFGPSELTTLFPTYYDRSYGVKIRLFDEGEFAQLSRSASVT